MGISNVIALLSGIALFLFGMALMGDGLKRVAGNKLELILYRLTGNPLKGFLLGAGVTAVIQSSSATSVMVVGFVNSGMMKVRQAISIVLGAILGTSITDYATALGMKEWNGTTGINVSGTSDLAPLDGQAAMIQELFPDAKNVGLIYCSAEANSIYQITVIKGYLEEMGYTCTEFAFTDSNDVASVTQSAADASDVIYIPTDNTAAAYTETIANVVIPAKVPVVAGEEGICKGCGVATLTISYYDLGYKTGEMAYDILANGADVSTMEVASAPNFTKKYNAANVEALGLTIPADYVAIE